MKIPFPADEQLEDGATPPIALLVWDLIQRKLLSILNIGHLPGAGAGRGDLGKRNDLLIRRLLHLNLKCACGQKQIKYRLSDSQ